MADSIFKINSGTITGVNNAEITTIKETDFPSEVREIARGAFRDLKKLETVEIPSTVLDIRKGAFANCDNLKKVVLPNGLSEISEGIFYQCKSLNSVTIPDSVRKIGVGVFYGCSNLSEIKIPAGVEKIDINVFKECANPLKVMLADNENARKIAQEMLREYAGGMTQVQFFVGDKRVRLNSDNNLEFVEPTPSRTDPDPADREEDEIPAEDVVEPVEDESEDEDVELPEGDVIVGNQIFEIKDGVLIGFINEEYKNEFKGPEIKSKDPFTQIGPTAFQNCPQLEEIIIPDGVTHVGPFAFAGCEKLTNIKFPEGIHSLDIYAFSNCKSLDKIEIPVGVTSLNQRLFAGCKNLSEISLPEGLEAIDECVFENCKNLKTIKIPKTVKTIKKGAFNGCEGIHIILASSDHAQDLSRQLQEEYKTLDEAGAAEYGGMVEGFALSGEELAEFRRIERGETETSEDETTTNTSGENYTKTTTTHEFGYWLDVTNPHYLELSQKIANGEKLTPEDIEKYTAAGGVIGTGEDKPEAKSRTVVLSEEELAHTVERDFEELSTRTLNIGIVNKLRIKDSKKVYSQKVTTKQNVSLIEDKENSPTTTLMNFTAPVNKKTMDILAVKKNSKECWVEIELPSAFLDENGASLLNNPNFKKENGLIKIKANKLDGNNPLINIHKNDNEFSAEIEIDNGFKLKFDINAVGINLTVDNAGTISKYSYSTRENSDEKNMGCVDAQINIETLEKMLGFQGGKEGELDDGIVKIGGIDEIPPYLVDMFYQNLIKDKTDFNREYKLKNFSLFPMDLGGEAKDIPSKPFCLLKDSTGKIYLFNRGKITHCTGYSFMRNKNKNGVVSFVLHVGGKYFNFPFAHAELTTDKKVKIIQETSATKFLRKFLPNLGLKYEDQAADEIESSEFGFLDSDDVRATVKDGREFNKFSTSAPQATYEYLGEENTINTEGARIIDIVGDNLRYVGSKKVVTNESSTESASSTTQSNTTTQIRVIKDDAGYYYMNENGEKVRLSEEAYNFLLQRKNGIVVTIEDEKEITTDPPEPDKKPKVEEKPQGEKGKENDNNNDDKNKTPEANAKDYKKGVEAFGDAIAIIGLLIGIASLLIPGLAFLGLGLFAAGMTLKITAEHFKFDPYKDAGRKIGEYEDYQAKEFLEDEDELESLIANSQEKADEVERISTIPVKEGGNEAARTFKDVYEREGISFGGHGDFKQQRAISGEMDSISAIADEAEREKAIQSFISGHFGEAIDEEKEKQVRDMLASGDRQGIFKMTGVPQKSRFKSFLSNEGLKERETIIQEIDAINNPFNAERREEMIETFMLTHFESDMGDADKDLVRGLFDPAKKEELDGFVKSVRELNESQREEMAAFNAQKAALGDRTNDQIGRILGHKSLTPERRLAIVERYATTIIKHLATDELTKEKIHEILDEIPEAERDSVYQVIVDSADAIKRDSGAIEEIAQEYAEVGTRIDDLEAYGDSMAVLSTAQLEDEMSYDKTIGETTSQFIRQVTLASLRREGTQADVFESLPRSAEGLPDGSTDKAIAEALSPLLGSSGEIQKAYRSIEFDAKRLGYDTEVGEMLYSIKKGDIADPNSILPNPRDISTSKITPNELLAMSSVVDLTEVDRKPYSFPRTADGEIKAVRKSDIETANNNALAYALGKESSTDPQYSYYSFEIVDDEIVVKQNVVVKEPPSTTEYIVDGEERDDAILAHFPMTEGKDVDTALHAQKAYELRQQIPPSGNQFEAISPLNNFDALTPAYEAEVYQFAMAKIEELEGKYVFNLENGIVKDKATNAELDEKDATPLLDAMQKYKEVKENFELRNQLEDSQLDHSKTYHEMLKRFAIDDLQRDGYTIIQTPSGNTSVRKNGNPVTLDKDGKVFITNNDGKTQVITDEKECARIRIVLNTGKLNMIVSETVKKAANAIEEAINKTLASESMRLEDFEVDQIMYEQFSSITNDDALARKLALISTFAKTRIAEVEGKLETETDETEKAKLQQELKSLENLDNFVDMAFVDEHSASLCASQYAEYCGRLGIDTESDTALVQSSDELNTAHSVKERQDQLISRFSEDSQQEIRAALGESLKAEDLMGILNWTMSQKTIMPGQPLFGYVALDENNNPISPEEFHKRIDGMREVNEARAKIKLAPMASRDGETLVNAQFEYCVEHGKEQEQEAEYTDMLDYLVRGIGLDRGKIIDHIAEMQIKNPSMSGQDIIAGICKKFGVGDDKLKNLDKKVMEKLYAKELDPNIVITQAEKERIQLIIKEYTLKEFQLILPKFKSYVETNNFDELEKLCKDDNLKELMSTMETLFGKDYTTYGITNPDILNLKEIFDLTGKDEWKALSAEEKKAQFANLMKTYSPVERGEDLIGKLSFQLNIEKESNTRRLEQTEINKDTDKQIRLAVVDSKMDVVNALSGMIKEDNGELIANIINNLKEANSISNVDLIKANPALAQTLNQMKGYFAEMFKDFDKTANKPDQLRSYLNKVMKGLKTERNNVVSEMEPQTPQQRFELADKQLDLLRDIYKEVTDLAKIGYSQDQIEQIFKTIAKGEFDSALLPDQLAKLMPRLIDNKAFIVKRFKNVKKSASYKKEFEKAIKYVTKTRDKAERDADQARDDALKEKTPKQKAKDEKKAKKQPWKGLRAIVEAAEQIKGVVVIEQADAKRVVKNKGEIEANEATINAENEQQAEQVAPEDENNDTGREGE